MFVTIFSSISNCLSKVLIDFLWLNMETRKSWRPMNMSEILPFLNGVVPKKDIQKYSEQYKPCPGVSTTQSNKKPYKPLTISELSSVIERLNPNCSKKSVPSSSAGKKKWNTSVKVENKKISHTENGRMRYNPVRKVLNMDSNYKIPSTPRTHMKSETHKFRKPEQKAKNIFSLHDRKNVRISGVCAIQDTPLIGKPIKTTRQTIANKENIPKVQFTNHDIISPVSTEVSTCKKLVKCDTPRLEEMYTSNNDDSFLRREKEIEDIEEMKTDIISEEQGSEKIAETPLPTSTPFKDCKSANDFFNDSARFQNSSLGGDDDTVMSIDKHSPKDNKREETVIVSLCNLLKKANLTNPKYEENTELDVLIEFKRQITIKIEMIQDSIETLNRIKESELKTLETLKRLIEMKNPKETTIDNIENLNNSKRVTKNRRCSVIKTRCNSPSYQIPKKNTCLRKIAISKSMPNVSNLQSSPNRGMNEKALSVYMKMKKHVTFLNTPMKSERKTLVPETPSARVTSLNLLRQLEKLYDE